MAETVEGSENQTEEKGEMQEGENCAAPQPPAISVCEDGVAEGGDVQDTSAGANIVVANAEAEVGADRSSFGEVEGALEVDVRDTCAEGAESGSKNTYTTDNAITDLAGGHGINDSGIAGDATILDEQPSAVTSDLQVGITFDDVTTDHCRMITRLVASASGAGLSVTESTGMGRRWSVGAHVVLSSGSSRQRDLAQKYTRLIQSSRNGFACIDTDKDNDEDLALLACPETLTSDLIGGKAFNLLKVAEETATVILVVDDGNCVPPSEKAPAAWLEVGCRVEVRRKGDVRYVVWSAATVIDVVQRPNAGVVRVRIDGTDSVQTVDQWQTQLRPLFQHGDQVEILSQESAAAGVSSWTLAIFHRRGHDTPQPEGSSTNDDTIWVATLAGQEIELVASHVRPRIVSTQSDAELIASFKDDFDGETDAAESKPPQRVVQIAIFGEPHGRCLAQLSLMKTMEQLQGISMFHGNGHCCTTAGGTVLSLPSLGDDNENYDESRWVATAIGLDGDEVSFLIPNTCRKLAAASGCVIQSLGAFAFVAGPQFACRLGASLVRMTIAHGHGVDIDSVATGDTGVQAFCARLSFPPWLIPILTGKNWQRFNDLEEEGAKIFLRWPPQTPHEKSNTADISPSVDKTIDSALCGNSAPHSEDTNLAFPGGSPAETDFRVKPIASAKDASTSVGEAETPTDDAPPVVAAAEALAKDAPSTIGAAETAEDAPILGATEALAEDAPSTGKADALVADTVPSADEAGTEKVVNCAIAADKLVSSASDTMASPLAEDMPVTDDVVDSGPIEGDAPTAHVAPVSDTTEDASVAEYCVFAYDDQTRLRVHLRLLQVVEQRVPGHITSNNTPRTTDGDDVAMDIIAFSQDVMSWLTGKQGANRKKVQCASGCAIEYLGTFAYLVGTGPERRRAEAYLQLLLKDLIKKQGPQLCALRELDLSPHALQERDDVTVVLVARDNQKLLTRPLLSNIENATRTMIFFREVPEDELFIAGAKVELKVSGRTFFAKLEEVPASLQPSDDCATDDFGIERRLLLRLLPPGSNGSWNGNSDASQEERVQLLIFGAAGIADRALAEKQVQDIITPAKQSGYPTDGVATPWSTWSTQATTETKHPDGSSAGETNSWGGWSKHAESESKQQEWPKQESNMKSGAWEGAGVSNAYGGRETPWQKSDSTKANTWEDQQSNRPVHDDGGWPTRRTPNTSQDAWSGWKGTATTQEDDKSRHRAGGSGSGGWSEDNANAAAKGNTWNSSGGCGGSGDWSAGGWRK
eukprot:TRINITY_DN38193_c0_g1_i1.p1 TRINITY_DN38193_c0_g1~~TRINITY_DN38193_c0_g1_i1.p1  ORF type:complete len:1267 (-),score=224.04 TRINITY_DN38193_c0_g1_i1:159-3959(-)